MYSATGRWRKLEKESYRDGYVQAQKAVGLAFQISALRKNKGWTEEELAKKCGWSKDRQIEIETVGGDELAWETLQTLAAAFDIGIMVKFASFSEMVEEEKSFDPNTFNVLSFNEDGLGRAKSENLKLVQVKRSDLRLVSNVAEERGVYHACSNNTIKPEKSFYEFNKQSAARRKYRLVLRSFTSRGR